MNLEYLINEFLLSLDDSEDEEYYMTERSHANKWLRKFLKWMKKRYVSFIGTNEIELPQERLDILDYI